MSVGRNSNLPPRSLFYGHPWGWGGVGGGGVIKLNFSAVKLLAQRPTRISAVATVLLVIKTFAVKYEREKAGEG